jgi:hypothetical protein
MVGEEGFETVPAIPKQPERRYTAASAGMFGVTGTAKHRIYAKYREP